MEVFSVVLTGGKVSIKFAFNNCGTERGGGGVEGSSELTSL